MTKSLEDFYSLDCKELVQEIYQTLRPTSNRLMGYISLIANDELSQKDRLSLLETTGKSVEELIEFQKQIGIWLERHR